MQAVHAGFDDLAVNGFDGSTGLTADRTELAEGHAHLNLGWAQHIPDRVLAADISNWYTDARVKADDRGVLVIAIVLAGGDFSERDVLLVRPY